MVNYYSLLIGAVFLVLVGVAVSRYIIPFLLHKSRSNFRFRTISPRSIRGLFIKYGKLTITIDRVGFSLHSPTISSTKHVHIQIQGLIITVSNGAPQVLVEPPRPPRRNIRSRYSVSNFDIAPPLALLAGVFPSRFLWWIDSLLRPIIGRIFLDLFRTIIRVLPSLTQILDFELDDATINGEALMGAFISIKGVTLVTKAEFSQAHIESVPPKNASVIDEKIQRKKRFYRMTAGWKDRLVGSSRRVWDRAWSTTNGSTTLALKVEGLSIFDGPSLSHAQIKPRAPSVSSLLGPRPATPSAWSFSIPESPSFDSFKGKAMLAMPAPAQLQISLKWTLASLENHSLVTSLIIPALEISTDALFSLKEKLDHIKSDSELVHVSSSSLPPTPTSPLPATDISFFSVRSRQSTSHTTVPKPKTSKWVGRSDWIRILNSLDLKISSLKLSHSIQADNSIQSISLSTVVQHLFVKLQISQPTENEIHRKWLGQATKPNSKLDADVLFFSSGMSTLLLHQVLGSQSHGYSQLLKIGQSGIDIIVTQWPSGWLPQASHLVDDHNAALVVCELRIDHVRASERLDQLQRTVSLFQFPKKEVTEHPPTVTPLRRPPRVIFDTRITDLRFRLQSNSTTIPSSTPFNMEFGTEHIGAHLSTIFHERASRSSRENASDLSANKAIPLRLEHWGHVDIAPCFARLASQTPAEIEEDVVIDEDAEWVDSFDGSDLQPESDTIFDQPDAPLTDVIFSTQAFEGDICGHALGWPNVDGEYEFTPADVIAEVKVRMEDIVVDLRSPIVSNALTAIVSTLKNFPASESPSKSVLLRLPTGVSAYIWIGAIHLGIADNDINPLIDLKNPVSRGVALRTSCVLEYCYLLAPHHTLSGKHGKPLFAPRNPRARDQLKLPDGIFSSASAFALEAEADNGRAALVRALFTQSRCWGISSRDGKGCDFPELENEVVSEGGRTHVDERILFDVPRLSVRAFLARASDAQHGFSDAAHLTVESSRIYWRFELLHAYNMLLVVHRIKSLVPSGPPRKSPSPSLSVTVHGKLEDVQGLCVFPSNERLYLRCTSIVMERLENKDPRMTGESMLAWIPSAQARLEGKWEELCRIRTWSIAIKIPTRPTSLYDTLIRLSADSGRLRIPYKYVLFHLIQGVTLAAKSIRHLVRDISAGKFQEMGLPMAESSKLLPSLDIHLGCLILEAADDPFETRLNLIWRAGIDEQRARLERILAFDAKVEAILQASRGTDESAASKAGFEWQFDPRHTVDPSDAWQRLQHYASESWTRRFIAAEIEQIRKEEAISGRIKGPSSRGIRPWTTIETHPAEKVVPLIRAIFPGLRVEITRPSFADEIGRQAFMADLGSGLPSSTAFTLLVPFHLKWAANSARISIRDYPLPILNVPEAAAPSVAWLFETDIVLGEELGPPSSVTFVPCTIFEADPSSASPAFTISVPKTIMPVKTYASPIITISTSHITDFSWGVSFTPVIADIMRVVDNITPAPRDPSPLLGFWDKLRLIFHWRLKASFLGDVHIHLKGTRDPYIIGGRGAGFVLEWKGRPLFTIGYSSQDQELLQLQSDRMMLAIPDLNRFNDAAATGDVVLDDDPVSSDQCEGEPHRFTRSGKGKVVAKFDGGVRMGMGFVFERDGPSSTSATDAGPVLRQFEFRPHYDVALQTYDDLDDLHKVDSYVGFRSDHIHYSISLTSAARTAAVRGSTNRVSGHNIFHLSPKAFAHFWAWWGLFNGALALPIRQGNLFPGGKAPTPKFSRHLSTIKYRITVAPLLISHVYHQESHVGWKAGQTACVGIKLMMDQFHADMHQREQVTSVLDQISGRLRTIVHKPFYSAEVVLIGSELRAVRAIFAEPEKALFSVPMDSAEPDSTPVPNAPSEPLSSPWVDLDDFVELDWTPSDRAPRIWLIPCGFCPRFTYLKRVPIQDTGASSRFGQEDTHHCLQGMEDSVYQIQLQFVKERLTTLREEHSKLVDEMQRQSRSDSASPTTSHSSSLSTQLADVAKRVKRLQDYIMQSSHNEDTGKKRDGHIERSYYMHMDDPIFSEHFEEFSNVYQVHCPKVVLSNTTRDILLDYYYSNRLWRGYEYHMATRAVKFIREQSSSPRPVEPATSLKTVRKVATRAAEKALRKLIPGDHSGQESKSPSAQPPFGQEDNFETWEDPRAGWSDDVVVRKKHFCLLLKPQIALCSEIDAESNLIAVAHTASLQNIPVLDSNHLDDVVHGVIMQRNYVKLSGLQVFSPNNPGRTDQLHIPDYVPLEVLVDYRCEHGGFTRLLPQTDGTLQYDKFNRLRLQNRVSAASAANAPEASEHLKNQTDRIAVNIPRFSVAANSATFAAIYNVISDLLLYHDPMQKAHCEALDRFIYLYDFRDRHTAADVVANIQRDLRQLRQVAQGYELHFDVLDQAAKLDLLAVKSQMFTLTKELGLIFEAISHVQAKMESAVGHDSFAIRLDASASEISWNMLDVTGSLLAKLSLRGLRYTWLSRMDGSMNNRLTIDDMQALNGSPAALFPEMLVKYEAFGASSKFMQVDWSALPPVGGISIIESFNLQLHPLRLQIERRTGRQIMAYVFARSEPDAMGQTESIDDSAQESSMATPHRSSMDSPYLLASTSSEVPGRRHLMIRSASHQNLRTANSAHTSNAPRKLRKTPSSDHLRLKGQSTEISRAHDIVKAVDADMEEMRLRSNHNRTFLHISVSSLICVLSYKRDTPMTLTTVPDLVDFKFRTPQFEYTNQIWSFEEAVVAMKRDFYREVWRQKGVLLREIALKAKFVTPRKFLTAAGSEVPPSSSAVSLENARHLPRKKWHHMFPGTRSSSPAPSQTDDAGNLADPESTPLPSPTTSVSMSSVSANSKESKQGEGEGRRRKRSFFKPSSNTPRRTSFDT